MAKVTVTVTKSENDKYTVKCSTSEGGGQKKCKGVDFEEAKEFIGGIIKDLDDKGLIGRK